MLTLSQNIKKASRVFYNPFFSFSHTNLYSKATLQDSDPEIYELIKFSQKLAQSKSINLSQETINPTPLRQAYSSVLGHKQAEGTIGKRYFGGCEFADQIEKVCLQRALSFYNLNPEEWGVMVQAECWEMAYFMIVHGLIDIYDRILYIGSKPRESAFNVDKLTYNEVYYPFYRDGEIDKALDFKKLESLIQHYRPKLLSVRLDCITQQLDLQMLETLVSSTDCKINIDISGIAGQLTLSENSEYLKKIFSIADTVLCSPNRSLFGPRSAMIYAKKKNLGLIQHAMFPRVQAEPQVQKIASIAVALKQASQDWFKDLQRNSRRNAQELSTNYGTKSEAGNVSKNIAFDYLLMFLNQEIDTRIALSIFGQVGVQLDCCCNDPSRRLKISMKNMALQGFKKESMRKIGDILSDGLLLASELTRQYKLNSNNKQINAKEYIMQNQRNVELQRLKSEVDELCDSVKEL